MEGDREWKIKNRRELQIQTMLIKIKLYKNSLFVEVFLSCLVFKNTRLNMTAYNMKFYTFAFTGKENFTK